MIKTFKVLSALLAYPGADLQQAAAAGELREALSAEKLLPAKHHAALLEFIGELAREDLYQLQVRYVALFDRTRSLSLHLFEHVHGDSRDRGQAMVDLAAMYERHGMQVAARELPDYLPLFLEFLSTLPPARAREILTQPLRILVILKQRLETSDRATAGYAAVFAALESIAGGQPAARAAKAAAKVVGEVFTGPGAPPGNLEALDRDWEEQAVLFGPANAPATPAGRVYVTPPAARNEPFSPN